MSQLATFGLISLTAGPAGPAGAAGAAGSNGSNGKSARDYTCLALLNPGNITLPVGAANADVNQVWNDSTGADVSSQFASNVDASHQLSQNGTTGMTAGDTLTVHTTDH